MTPQSSNDTIATSTEPRSTTAPRRRGRRHRLGGPIRPKAAGDPSRVTRDLVARTRFELMPVKSLDAAIDALPGPMALSVTCSPAKGIGRTLDTSARLFDLGHEVAPHLAARLVESREHTAAIARWLREHSVREVLIIAGDSPTPAGPYDGALPFMRDLLERDTGLTRVGVAAYPDGHSLIAGDTLHEALHAKQRLLSEAGIAGVAVTQMCFDARSIRGWVAAERGAGLMMPVHLGIPGIIDRTKLAATGARLGIGASLRYVKKNRSSVVRMLAPGRYDPTGLVESLAKDATPLGIAGLHSFTFNNVADTLAWQRAIVG